MRKICALLLSVILAFALFGCGEEKTPQRAEGLYEMTQVTVDGFDATGDFTLYTVEFAQQMTVKTGYFGLVATRTVDYELTDNVAVETGTERRYTFDGDTLTYTGSEPNIGAVVATFEKVKSEELVDEVDFDSILFGSSIKTTKFYNYCPAVMLEEDGKTMHIYYCTNKVSGEIYDCIAYRVGIKTESGKWKFGEESIALEPTADTWDERHVCDPAVIKGVFEYKNENYSYMMLYLGCKTEDNSNNENGMAVAKSPAGPWVKVYFGENEDEPLAPFAKNPAFKDTWEWGKGQSAIINVDKESEVLVFTTTGGAKSLGFSGTWLERWDFSDLDNPKKLEERALPTTGIKDGNGRACGITNGDYVYDPSTGRIYFSAERGPITPEGEPSFVHSHSHVMYMEPSNSGEAVGANLFAAQNQWQLVKTLDYRITGYHRNHNTGIVRDMYGHLPSADTVQVIVTTAILDQPNEGVFTYRLRGITVDIDKEMG